MSSRDESSLPGLDSFSPLPLAAFSNIINHVTIKAASALVSPCSQLLLELVAVNFSWVK